MGLTAYTDGADAAQSAFAMPLWKLLLFSYSNDSWSASIKEAVNYLKSRSRPPFFNDGQTYHIDVGVLVALEGEELAGLKRLPYGWTEYQIPHDPSRYLVGTVKHAERDLQIVAVASPRMGLTPAAVTATKLITNFRPRLLVMTGICAGVRGKADMGDVLVADPCFDWGSGKWVYDEHASKPKFQPAAYQWRLEEAVRSALRALGDDGDLMRSIHEGFMGKKPSAPPKVIIEAMASGAAVLQSADSREPLKTTVFIQCPAVFAGNFRVCPFFEQIALFSGLFVPHSSRIGPLQAYLGL